MSYTTWTEIRTEITDAIDGIDSVGKAHTSQLLAATWPEFMKRFRVTDGADRPVRGWLVLPGRPFRVPLQDAVGQLQDSYSFLILGFQSAQDDESDFQAALDRSLQVAEVLDGLWPMPDVAAEVFRCGPCTIQSHEFRKFGPIGVWYTEMSYDVVVNRALTYQGD